MTRTDSNLLRRTRELWSERYGRPITEEEAQEIIDNMTEFARILIDWYVAERESCDHSSAETSASPDADLACRE